LPVISQPAAATVAAVEDKRVIGAQQAPARASCISKHAYSSDCPRFFTPKQEKGMIKEKNDRTHEQP
jgi:hypothetical protein